MLMPSSGDFRIRFAAGTFLTHHRCRFGEASSRGRGRGKDGGGQMSETFHWNMQLPRGGTYAERAMECRCLAQVCPDDLRESYLKLAAEYEQLAKANR